MENKKNDIIEITARLMHSKGYGATSVKDIMEAAQIGKGQFYYYFSSKEELGLAVVDDCFEKWQQRVIMGNLAKNEKPQVRIERMLSCMIEVHQSRESKCGCFFGNLAIELSEHNAIFREKIATMFACWTEELEILIDQWQKEHRTTVGGNSRLLAVNIVALLEGAILLMKSQQSINPLLQAAVMVKKILGMEAGSEKYLEK